MSLDEQFVAEICQQLKEDILDFGWLRQMARLDGPGRNPDELNHAVVEAVGELHRRGIIVIGDARETHGVVLIEAWPESGDRLATRIWSAIESNRPEDQGNCFWIQLVEHYSREPE